jgi:hypothetical protein
LISNNLKLILAVAMLCLAARSSQCVAEVIAFSNYDPGSVYNSGGWVIGPAAGPYEFKLAQRFTPSVTGRLSKLDLLLEFNPVNYQGLNVDELTLRIVSDENGIPAGAELWSQTYFNEATRVQDDSSSSSFDAANGIELKQGAQYWLTATTIQGALALGPYRWWFTDTGKNEPRATYYIRGVQNGQWPVGQWIVNQYYDQYPFEFGLRVTIIPEPAAPALMLAASATLVAVRRRSVISLELLRDVACW